jgi:hypothetical protein
MICVREAVSLKEDLIVSDSSGLVRPVGNVDECVERNWRSAINRICCRLEACIPRQAWIVEPIPNKGHTGEWKGELRAWLRRLEPWRKGLPPGAYPRLELTVVIPNREWCLVQWHGRRRNVTEIVKPKRLLISHHCVQNECMFCVGQAILGAQQDIVDRYCRYDHWHTFVVDQTGDIESGGAIELI